MDELLVIVRVWGTHPALLEPGPIKPAVGCLKLVTVPYNANRKYTRLGKPVGKVYIGILIRAIHILAAIAPNKNRSS